MFDVVVVGGGHGGIEAALAAWRLGAHTCLVTHSIRHIGLLSCNPAIGGIGKSHLVHEIDALGGAMAENSDATAIQYRTLNTQKGPAVRATRVQCDRLLYAARIQEVLLQTDGLVLVEGDASGLLYEKGRVSGVLLAEGSKIEAHSVVLTTGTFLNGLLHFGDKLIPGGRLGDPPSIGMSDALRKAGLRVDRLKTGTPPRLLTSSLDLEAMIPQPSDPDAIALCAWKSVPRLPQRSCHITHTNKRTHDIIRANLHQAPMFTGQIESIGPRYCPSLESKIVTFAHRDSHHVFIEPEGLNSPEVYPNGLSSSLPEEVQWEFVRTIRGLEEAVITQPGYAVEYDFVDPRDVGVDMQCKGVPALYLAGQILGTTGYEEAGALGLLAGANAALKVQKRPMMLVDRASSYLGVMVDDLITRGVTEPYRMFTSRAEFRLALREDNALERMVPLASSTGLLSAEQQSQFAARIQRLQEADALLDQLRISPTDVLEDGQMIGGDGLTYRAWLKRPQSNIDSLIRLKSVPQLDDLTPRERHALAVRTRYDGYIQREKKEIERFRRMDGMKIPKDFLYKDLPGLSAEVCERLDKARPATLGIASRLEGITPAAVTALLLRLRSGGV